MLTNEDQVPVVEEKTPGTDPNGYNAVDVDMKDTVGAVFLGILSFILLIGWVRAEARYRDLINQLHTR